MSKVQEENGKSQLRIHPAKIDLEKSPFMSASENKKECIQRNEQKNSHFQGNSPLHLDLIPSSTVH